MTILPTDSVPSADTAGEATDPSATMPPQFRDRAFHRGNRGPRMTAKDFRDTVGLLGVIASLIFVGLEVRQNTRVARAEAYRGLDQAMAQWYFVAATDDELVPLLRGVFLEGVRRDELSGPDKWRVGMMLDAAIRSHEFLFRQVEEGVLPPHSLDRAGSITFNAPYMRDLWPVVRSQYREDFAAYFEARYQLGSPVP